jgi:hypothetical protein
MGLLEAKRTFFSEAQGGNKATFYSGRRHSLGLFFGVKMDDIGAENPYFLDIKTEQSRT